MARNYEANPPPLPLHLCVFILILLMFIGLSLYGSYEPVFEGLMDQVKLLVVLSPLILLVVVHFLSNGDAAGLWGLWRLIPQSEDRDSLHQTPWGVLFMLVFIFFMASYHSQLQERWFPLLAR